MGIGRILTPGVPRKVAAAFGLAFGLTVVGAHAQTFTGPGITVSGTDGQSVGSAIQVSGLSGTLASMSLTFNSLNVTNLNGIGVVLVSPGGQALDVMSGMCGLIGPPGSQQVGSSTFTLADTGATGTGNDNGYMAGWPEGSSTPDGTCPAAYSGTYLPTDYYSTLAVFNSPGPSTYSAAGNPAGAASTFASVFGSSTLNGTWTLYIANQTNASGSLGSWSLTFTTTSTNTNTTTSLATNASNNETTISPTSVTLTATVTSTGTVNGGTVTFSDDGTNVTCSGGNPVAVSSGTAQCSTSFSTEGVHPLTATYSGSSGTYNGSGSALLNLFADHPTTNPSSGQYCNAGGLSISSSLTASNNPATPYPSHIDVSGYSGTITGATLTLNGFSDADPQTTAMLLVGPTGGAFLPWDNVGGTTAVTGIGVTLADSAGSSNTIASPPVNGSTYYPTANLGTPPVFPTGSINWSPPTTFGGAPPYGTETFAGAFNGINPNGEWSLYLYNAAGSTALSATSWCVNLLQQTSMTVHSSHIDPFTQGDSADTYTITVKNGGTVATSGTLDLNDALPSGMTPVSFRETGNTGGGTGSDWSCSGVGCTRTTAMPVNEQDTLTLTVGVGYTTAIGTGNNNSVTVSGGNLSGTASYTDPTTVNAGQVQVTFNTVPAGLSYSVGGAAYSSQQTLSETNGSTILLATTSPQTLSSTQYLFSNWSDSGTLSHNATISSTNGTANYTATFNSAYTLTTAANPSIGGSVSPATGTYGGTVNLTATPNTNWAFTSWTGPVASSTSASTTITMSANESATANFAPNGQTTVWIVNSIGGLGELTAAGPATTTAYTGGNTAVAIDATGSLWTLNSSSPLLYETNQLGVVKASLSSGGLNAPVSLAIDGAGQVWVVNGNGTVSLFSNAGSALSPSGGFTDSSLDAPSSVAVDQSGSVWIANKTGSSLTRILGAAAPAAPLSTAAANNTTGVRP